MAHEPTLRKLHEMRLATMADSYQNQLLDSNFQALSFEERFGLLVDLEWSRRKNNRLSSLIRKADFQQNNACIEDVEYHADRKLDRTQILRLATGAYIQDKLIIIIMGASGAGKTYLACAFGIAACRNFYPVKYIRLPELLNELAVARGEGIYQRVMKTYKKIPLLILDEWLLVSLKESEARDLLEIVEARHEKGSTIFCSQFTPAGWHGKIGENTLADAILDRIVHSSYTITIEGMDSMRKRKGLIN
ncbi:IS21-like element helper ATPase IstB [Paenibacillus roseipurpureus]|uniref:IS21-like element helper ATPase IstB n=1 Tax=Paenibacillus roseopurpureus TaxID=2918901 RepID=A0AA96LQ30_9BACL|nr:IS21-like element helper ATPase IstB [Paenibacillus sp. MBLB1832]WNR45237.1 IS21-like element helper ATPase IstB [Paenibacillus sp. MBLB1832]